MWHHRWRSKCNRMVRQLIVHDKQFFFCARICRTRKLSTEYPRLAPSGLFDLGNIPTACLPSSSHLRCWAPERSPTNLLEADWSRRYRSSYRTVSQMIVTRCCNRWRTHWAPLWLMFLVLHIRYPFAFAFAFGVDYVQRWGRPSIAAQCATPVITKG